MSVSYYKFALMHAYSRIRSRVSYNYIEGLWNFFLIVYTRSGFDHVRNQRHGPGDVKLLVCILCTLRFGITPFAKVQNINFGIRVPRSPVRFRPRPKKFTKRKFRKRLTFSSPVFFLTSYLG